MKKLLAFAIAKSFCVALLFTMFLSTVQANEIIDLVTIDGSRDPIKFVNGFNLEKCMEYDRFLKTVEKVSNAECNGRKNYYAKQAAEEAQVRLQEEYRIELKRQNAMKDLEEKQREQDYQKEQAEKNLKWQEKYRFEQQKIAAKREQDRKDYDARFYANQVAEKAAHDRQKAEWDRKDRAAQKQQDAKISELKLRCGDDYKNPSIGMKIERVKECIAPVKMVSQLNRVDGVVSSYQYGSQWFNVMSGRVVAWGK